MIEKLMNSLSGHIGEPRWYKPENSMRKPIVIFDWRQAGKDEENISGFGEYGFFVKSGDNAELQSVVDEGDGAWITDTLIPFACIGEHYGDAMESFPFVDQIDELWFLSLDEVNKTVVIMTWDSDAPDHRLMSGISAFDLPGLLTDEDPYE